MSFDFDASSDVIDGPGSYQGDFSSSYTDALRDWLQTDQGADFAAFLSAQANGLSLEAALALKALIQAGEFQLDHLFAAAQSKTGPVDGAAIGDPVPALTVAGVVIDLSPMLADAQTVTWETVNRGGTVFHTREFFAASQPPEGYTEGWADGGADNQPPTADPILLELTEYDEHAQALADPVLEQVDLLTAANAQDPDGDPLAIVDGSVQLQGGGSLPGYISYAGSVLSIDRNHEDLDALLLGDTWDVVIEYQISDGNGHVIGNTVHLSIEGTADQFSGSTDVSASHTTFDTSTWSGDFSFVLAAPEGAFDFAGTATVTVTGDIDNNAADDANDEVVSVALEGGAAVLLGTWDSPPNQEGSGNFSTRSADAGFASADATVDVSYDAQTAGGVNGVDGLSLVGVNVTADYSYWL